MPSKICRTEKRDQPEYYEGRRREVKCLSETCSPFPASRIEGLCGGSHLTSPLFQIQVFPMDLNRVPSRSTKSLFVVMVVESYITQGIET